MFILEACRGCLSMSSKLEKLPPASSRLYQVLTDLNLDNGDGYPSMFCLECRLQIKKALAFRRKSKRAHFVMKEIMNVTGQITLKDIVRVDRIRTNLDSTLGYWKSDNSGFYAIKCNEVDGEIETDMHAYNPDRDELSIYHLVDIKPDRVDLDNDAIIDLDNDGIEHDDYKINNEEKDVPANIDLEDVFKDLVVEEESAESDFELVCDEKKKLNKHTKSGTTSCWKYVKALCNSYIRVLNISEQKELFEKRKQQKCYVEATHKCSICLSVFDSQDDLFYHVHYHNTTLIGPHHCQVCLIGYPERHQLEVHIAECHLYEYSCKHCSDKKYTLVDIVAHQSEHSSETTQLKKSRMSKQVLFSEYIAMTLHSPEMMNQMKASQRSGNGIIDHSQSKQVYNTCDICEKRFKSLDTLSKHIVDTHMYSYDCMQCSQKFNTRSQAEAHVSVCYEIATDKVMCHMCEKTFKKTYHLQLHLNHTHNTKVVLIDNYHCNLCGQVFTKDDKYYRHQFEEHKYISINSPLIGDAQFACANCEVQFVSSKSYQTHLLVMGHEGATQVRNACMLCKNVYDTEDELASHVCNHLRKCPYCEMMLSSREYRTHHHKTHPDLEYKPLDEAFYVLCELCGKYIKRNVMSAHMEEHNEDAYRFKCPYCDSKHLDATLHFMHVVDNHAISPYICGICYTKYTTKHKLKRHILKIHCRDNFYKCVDCVADFSHPRQLKEHAIKMHNNSIKADIHKKRKYNMSKKKVIVYPNMLIDSSLVSEEICKQVNVEMVDYMGLSFHPVANVEEYFMRLSMENEIIKPKRNINNTARREKLLRKRRLKNEIVHKEKTAKKNKLGQKFKLEEKAKREIEVEEETVELLYNTDMNDGSGLVIENLSMNEIEVNEGELEMILDDDGNKYISVNGNLYKIEDDS